MTRLKQSLAEAEETLASQRASTGHRIATASARVAELEAENQRLQKLVQAANDQKSSTQEQQQLLELEVRGVGRLRLAVADVQVIN